MKIHYSNPYSSNKNIGKALNDFCALIPDGDWICLQDGDIMYLTPDWGKQIDEVVKTHGSTYSLFGCYTNRLGRTIQRHDGLFSDNFNIKHHYDIAVKREQAHWREVVDVTRTKRIAGMFMLFPKSLWNKIKFEENCPNFDDKFSQAVIEIGGKLGLLKGLYVFHCYRLWAKHPNHERHHLIQNP